MVISMDFERDIHPLTDFKRNTLEFVKQLEETGEPLILTVNGKAKLVVQSAAYYQQLLDARERLETILDIREGLNSIERGEGIPIKEAFALLRKEHAGDA